MRWPISWFQFSLSKLFALVTLCAIGTWYWYQRPFAVETKLADPNPTADPFALLPPAGPAWLFREVDYVRRVWGGTTVRHGPRRVYYSNGNLASVENYRNGQRHGEYVSYDSDGNMLRRETYVLGELHGPSHRWNAKGELIFEAFYDHGALHGKFDDRDDDGKPTIEAFFEHGRPVGKWTWYFAAENNVKKPGDKLAAGTIRGQWREGTPGGRWEWRDRRGSLYLSAEFSGGKLTGLKSEDLSPRLLEALVMASGETPQILRGAFDTATLDFQQRRLTEVASYATDLTQFPVVISLRNLEKSGISLDSPISFQAQDTPFLLALKNLLATHELGCDYRYGALFIDTLDSIAHWQDATGVLQIVPPPGSELEAEWNNRIDFNVANVGLPDFVAFLQKQLGTPIQWSVTPQSPSVRVRLQFKGVSVKNALAILLGDLNCKASLRNGILFIEPQ